MNFIFKYSTFLLFLFFLFLGCKDHNNLKENNLLVCEEVLSVAEQMPELIGGQAEVQRRLKYPSVAVRAGVEGTVTVEAVVDKLGNPDSVRVISGIGGGCDEESLRLMQTTNWEAGKMKGKRACVKVTLPIIFSLP